MKRIVLTIAVAAVALFALSGCTYRAGDFAHPHGDVTACIVSGIDADEKTVPNVAAWAHVAAFAGDECNVGDAIPMPFAEVQTSLWARQILDNGLYIDHLCSDSLRYNGINETGLNASITGGCTAYSWADDPHTQWYARSQAWVTFYGNVYSSGVWYSPTEVR